MRVILLGPPGSGKGSVGERVAEAYGFPKISTGDLLRDAVRRKTRLGLQAEAQLGKGKLVEDALVNELLRERLADPDARAGYILDGYPRNLDQAESLERLDGGRKEVAFEIEIREETLVRRLSGRLICPSCEAIYNRVTRKPAKEGLCDRCGAALLRRPDDDPEVIAERMRTHSEKTEPLTARYEAKGVLHRIDGNGTVDETFLSIRRVLDRELGGGEGERAGK